LIIGRKIRNLILWPALHLSADANRCTDCRRCSRICPMGLDVNAMVRQRSMENTDCILCGACVDGCQERVIRYALIPYFALTLSSIILFAVRSK
jgi:polyferredoxin